jgi:pimeloyl-ACP methyl ester carboxylesterase
MPAYAQLGDVHAYYEEDGDGEPLVLLRPGLADSRAFEEHVPELSERFRVFRPDRRGHGRTADIDGPITYAAMAEETIAFLERVVGGPAHLLGHSDGAPVALLVALARPELVRRLVLSAGVFHHDGWTPGAIDLDEETVAFFVGYDEIRPARTLALYKALPDAQLAVLPGTGHGGIDTRVVIDFLTAPREDAGR